MQFHRWSAIFLTSALATCSITPSKLTIGQDQNTHAVAQFVTELERLSLDLPKQPSQQTQTTPLQDYVRRLRQQANQSSTEAWSNIKSLADWQRFRKEKLALLRQSLGQPTTSRVPLSIEVTRRHTDPAGRFVIENIVYQSRPEVWVTANLYRPAKSVTSAPGFIISHAHHTPKEHAELQAMGMIWAQAGCYVLVPDHFGHGERRQHPFVNAEAFPGNFRVSRQDYYFRYDLGIKLHLLGESLMSWLAWDLSRGVDCLLTQPGIDPAKIILLGSVAGGGDPCAVAAALDERITAAVPFNFGGPQPETPYPLPDDAESTFNYVGSGSWESTRNLTNSASDGFLPWTIVGSIAPRRLIYAHEFRWDQEHDPVWRRLRSIFDLYGQPDALDFTHGRGELRGQPPEATHCTHIGAFHRQRMHQAFEKWFGIQVSPAGEILEQLPAESLVCLVNAKEKSARSTLVDFEALARSRMEVTRAVLAQQTSSERRQQLQSLWSQLLNARGSSSDNPPAAALAPPHLTGSHVRIENMNLSSADGMQIPLLLLQPVQADKSNKPPVVLVVQTLGRAEYWNAHLQEMAKLLAAGQAVCIPDLRGAGESRGTSRGRTSAATSTSSNLLMLGDPLVAGQLRDLRRVWAWLRTRNDMDADHIQVWADSRRPAVASEKDRIVPRDDDSLVPPSAEPSACLLALLLSLYEDSVQALCLSGGLNNVASALGPQQVRIPHDCVIPGLFQAGDIEELIIQAAERLPVRCEAFVDGRNMRLSPGALDAYQTRLRSLCSNTDQLKLTVDFDSQATAWILRGK